MSGASCARRVTADVTGRCQVQAVPAARGRAAQLIGRNFFEIVRRFNVV